MTGKTKGLINLNVLKAVALTVTALAVFSCQKEHVAGYENDGRVTIYPVITNHIQTEVFTRGAIDKTKYTEYTDQNHGSRQALSVRAISFEMGSNTRADKDASGAFAPLDGGLWRSGVTVEPGYDYELYVYSRIMPSATDPEFSYENGSASLAFDGMSLLTTEDPLVCVAANAKDLSETPAANEYPELNEGEFFIGTIPSTFEAGNSYKAFLAMNHLYAKATLSFRIAPEYKNVRDIRIKAVEISTAHGTLTGTHTYTFSNDMLTLATQNSTLDGNRISIDLFNRTSSASTLNLDQDSTYYTLTKNYKEFGYFQFLPVNPLDNIQLKVTYDVCDLKGNVTRADQEAVNSNLFSSIRTTAQRGYNYKVNVTVGPTYLYQLSDDDVEIGLTIQEE